jgi:Ca2+/Na+ antiporter
MPQNNIYLSKLFLAMFHFTEYFVKKSIRNGILLLLIAAFLIYLSSNSIIHNVSIFVFLLVAVCWIYFGIKFKKQLDSVDEPTNHETDTNSLKFLKIFDSILSGSFLIIMTILTLRFPSADAIYYLVTSISILFVLRIYQIVIISKYLKKEVRN